MIQDCDKYIIWLQEAFSAKPEKVRQLLKHFSPKEVFENSLHFGLPTSPIHPDDLLQKCHDIYGKQTAFIAYNNPAYPSRLKNIPNAPLGLFVQGALPDENVPAASIIGTRKNSDYGAQAARSITKSLAGMGIGIISGLAAGIDTLAHEAALDADGYTAAVLGCSLDVCYPAENRRLMQKILDKGGALFSEYLPQTRPVRWNFPVRNRIVAGLSDCVIVVETTIKSGTNHTVNHALAQGREVFAVPGSIFSKSNGTNEMIKEGAQPLTSPHDALLYLYRKRHFSAFFDAAKMPPKGIDEKIMNKTLAKNEMIVYSCINHEPITADLIMQKSGMEIAKVLQALTMLELDGLIMKMPGQRYALLV